MKLYAYCLTENIDALPQNLVGIAGAEVRLLDAESFSLLVSDFSGEVVPVNRENALAHAAVVRSVLDRTTPLPFRFATLGTEEQLRSFLLARRDDLVAKFAQVRGCVEMNVKIISDPEPAEEVDDQTGGKPGTSFLLQKKREIAGSEARAANAKSVAGWLEGLVGQCVKETRINTGVKGKLLLTAAHLVERNALEEYRDRLKTVRRERPDLKFLFSGPWAPYSFANIELEFHGRFGVS